MLSLTKDMHVYTMCISNTANQAIIIFHPSIIIQKKALCLAHYVLKILRQIIGYFRAKQFKRNIFCDSNYNVHVQCKQDKDCICRQHAGTLEKNIHCFIAQ